MRGIKYKSLTMRIWMTFTIIILIIICSISLVYMLVYRGISKNAKVYDLKASHEILLKNNNYNGSLGGFDKMRNLRGSNYFILSIDDSGRREILNVNGVREMMAPPIDISKKPPEYSNLKPPAVNIFETIFSNIFKNRNKISSIDFNSDSVKMWMGSFVKSNNESENVMLKSYKGIEIVFIISSINSQTSEKQYLISYMPQIEDNTILYMTISIGVLFIFIGFFVSKIVAIHISKPLKELEKFTVRISHKDWKEPIKVNSDDEIGRLANSMNHMQKELKRADDEEKMFLQSISHDLKTPVMVIMSHADAIIDGVYIDSVEKTAQIIRDEAINLEKKIKQMLYLNTLDYVLENNEQNDIIELHDLLLYIISRFEVINSKIQWELNIDKVIINGNMDKMQVAIENILDNGLRYAEEKICVTLKIEDKFAVLEIFNDGPSIPEEHISHIFDNLYKDKTGNFGLGLAISKKIIDFYNGEITVVNKKKGVSFIIKYPVDM